jgi:hypothetical protein
VLVVTVALVLSFGHWWEELPRETIVCVAGGAGVTLALGWLGHIKLNKPAKQRHRELLEHAQHQTMLAEEQHYLAHHAGRLHPRVQARLDRDEDRTPTLGEL